MKKGQKKSNYSKEEELLICDLYVNQNKSMQQIGDIYSRSEFFISTVLNKYKIKRRNITRSTFDETYFEQIDTKDKAYFLGLLMSDGCNYRNGITLSLQDEDYKVIELFKKYINFTGKINYRNHTNPEYKGIVRIKIHSDLISKQLTNWNVIPNKSLNTAFPNILEEFYSHFIRGIFDGDGCICTYKNDKISQFSIIGCVSLIERIQEILVKNCLINITKLKKNKLHNINTIYLDYTGYRRLSRIFDWLYQDCDDLYIDRKFLKFKRIKDERI